MVLPATVFVAVEVDRSVVVVAVLLYKVSEARLLLIGRS